MRINAFVIAASENQWNHILQNRANNLHPLWSVHEGKGPILATALHAGHEIREEMARIIALEESTRLREEDPYTDELAKVVPTRIVPLHSRFEVDLNRPRDQSVYINPEDAWGLQIWRHKPNPKMIARSLQEFDQFYAQTNRLLRKLEREYGRFVVFDIHSYNYRRKGPNSPPDDPAENPDINIGTGTLDRQKWAPVIDRFIHDLRIFDYEGKHLDVRENVKFKGRQFATWVHHCFPNSGCVLSIELKKIFMNEWTGELKPKKLKRLFAALKSTLPGIAQELKHL